MSKTVPQSPGMDEDLIPSYKVVLLGESGTGKTSLVMRFVRGQFFALQEPTVGATFLSQVIQVEDGRKIKFEIWDTAGQERFRSLIPMYYRQASAALVIYDITKEPTFRKGQSWVKETKRHSENQNIVVAFVGNKSDLEETRGVERERAEFYAEENGLVFYECSAKNGKNVKEVFQEIAEKLIRKLDEENKNVQRDEFDTEFEKYMTLEKKKGEKKEKKGAGAGGGCC